MELSALAATEFTVRCQECAHGNAMGGKFCTACGVRLDVVCVACGRGCPATSHYCGWCGAPRAAGTRLTEPSGERKQATVMFADIVGSTELIAGLDAEAAKDRIEPVVKAMARAVRRFNGTVLRTLGDGLKASFGAPHAQEGHALLACRAALAIQEAIAAWPEATRIRIGLQSGEVVHGMLDTGSAVEQDVQGMTVHLASRIEQAADPGAIHLGRECWALVEAYCDATSIGVRTLKGSPDLVEIYRLIGLKPAVNSEHFRGAGLTRMRGRAEEFAVLRQALLDAGQGSGGVIGISGEAGTGKSRLCFEFAEWCREQRVQVLEARAHVLGQATPLLPILDMLRVYFRVAPGLDPKAGQQKISERLLALDPSLADGMPLLADFLNVATPEMTAPALDPRTRQMRLRDIVGRMAKAAGQRTAVIIFEDLHWLDEASQDFVETIAEAVRGTNLVMVVTFRPPWSARWMERTEYREIRLAELGRGDMRQLVGDLTGDEPALEPVVTHVADQSGGNPFFAQELVLSLVQSGVLLGARGRYRLTAAGWNDPVLPATVEAVIGARIDHLTEHQKMVLQIGAVIGKEFPSEVVREVAGTPEPALQLAFDQLCAREMIQPCVTYAGASFAFRHPLIHQVAYAMQLRARRTPLHESVANAIKRFDWGLLDETAGVLAYHYEAAGQKLEAAMHLQRGARWIGRTNSARALADWKKVRRLMQGQPRSETNDQLRALAGGQLLTFGWREGMEAKEAKLYAEEALHYAREAGNRKHEVMLLGAYGRIMAANGAADDYVRLVREALALTDQVASPEVSLLLNGLLCQAYGHTGLFLEALAASDAALRIVEDESRPTGDIVLGLTVAQMVGFDVLHWIRCLRARLLVLLGRFDEAESSLARVIQIDPKKVEPFHQCLPHWAMVEMAWHHTDAPAAKSQAREVARYAELSGMPYVWVLSSLCHGLSYFIEGELEVAAQHFRNALETARHSGAGRENEARLLALLADADVRSGDHAGAGRIAAEAIDVARRRTDRYAECHATIVMAVALAGSQQPREAAELLDRAEKLIHLTGAEILRPRFEQALSVVDKFEQKCF